MPPEIQVVHKAGDTAAVLMVRNVHRFNGGKPIEAKVDVDNGQRVTFAWDLRTSVGSQATNFKFRLTVQKGSKKATMSGYPVNYANKMHSNGSCTLS